MQKARHIVGYLLVAVVAWTGVIFAALAVPPTAPTTAEPVAEHQGHSAHASRGHRAHYSYAHADGHHPSGHYPPGHQATVKDHSAHSLSECLVVCAEAAADPSLLPVANSSKRGGDLVDIKWHQATAQFVPAVGKWVARLARGPPGEVPSSLSYFGAQRVLMRHAPLRI
ncbi:MAG: hypothetical protein AAFV47_14575 [Pseudomonadota bacterium]